MSMMSEHHDLKEASTRSLVAVVAVMIVSALAFTAVTAPFAKLLGNHAGAVPAAFHGLAAFLFLFMGTGSISHGDSSQDASGPSPICSCWRSWRRPAR